MADLHVDQSVPGGTGRLLAQGGHAVVTARGLGMWQAEDPEHLLHAALHHRILITRDNDFLTLHIAWLLWSQAWQVQPLPEHAGIVIIPSQWPVHVAAREIDALRRHGVPFSNILYRYEAPPGGWVRH